MCALERKESRGGHFRDDFPDKDPAYAKFNLIVSKGSDGRPKLRREPIKELRDDLKQVIEENK
jgi:succinate dehydrogenase / fumarate reductase flavoprotein subunit